MDPDLEASELAQAPANGDHRNDGDLPSPPAARAVSQISWSMPWRPVIDLPYTAAADPETESEVRTLLEQITSAVVAEFQPAAIVLYGSLGRGEGGAYRVGHDMQLVTDVSLMAIFTGAAAVPRAWQARRRTAKLRKTLAETLAVSELHLATLPALLLKAPPLSLESYEMVRSARLLHGQAELASPAAVPLEGVPPGDFARRLDRAGSGLLVAWSWLLSGEGDLSEATARAIRSAIDAAFLACGDTWLFRTRQYDHRLAVRAEWLRLPFAAGPGPSTRLREEYQFAAREQLFPNARVSTSRAEHAVRWERAAIEWLGCARVSKHWKWWARYGLRQARSGWHPVRRSMGLMVDAAETRHDDGISHRTQGKVLPLLIEWALDGWDHPVRRDQAAYLLHAKREEARDLTYLVAKYLLASHLTNGIPTSTQMPLTALPARTSH